MNFGRDLKKHWMEPLTEFVRLQGLQRENILEKIFLQSSMEFLRLVAFIEERSPKIVAEYREKLEAKVKELLEDTQIEENQYCSRSCDLSQIRSVQMKRSYDLKSHVVHMKETLQSDEAGIGRKLDFIAQEMNREANTILSKANDLEVSNIRNWVKDRD